MQFPYYLDKVLGHGPIFAVIKPMLSFAALQYFAINRLAAQCWKALLESSPKEKIHLAALRCLPPRFLSTNERASFRILTNVIGSSLTRFRILKKKIRFLRKSNRPEPFKAKAVQGQRPQLKYSGVCSQDEKVALLAAYGMDKSSPRQCNERHRCEL